MKDFSTFPNTANAFPEALARNATSPSIADGTPLLADIYNDWWGFAQACLNRNGVAPSGDVEVYNDSQVYDAIVNAMSPVGAVIPIMINDDPATLGLRLIIMENQMIEVALYPELVAACYVGDAYNGTADAFYRADATGITRDINGSHMRLPNSANAFLRSVTPGALPGANRKMGESQSSYIEDHKHDIGFTDDGIIHTPNYTVPVDSSALPAGSDLLVTLIDHSTNVYVEAETVLNAAVSVYETAPQNVACKLAIRY